MQNAGEERKKVVQVGRFMWEQRSKEERSTGAEELRSRNGKEAFWKSSWNVLDNWDISFNGGEGEVGVE